MFQFFDNQNPVLFRQTCLKKEALGSFANQCVAFGFTKQERVLEMACLIERGGRHFVRLHVAEVTQFASKIQDFIWI
jgi:hypothetical protein